MRPISTLLLSASVCLGQLVPPPYSPSATLAWNASPSTNVVCYWIYSGFNSGQYVDKLNAGPGTQFTVTDLIAGKTYWFAATAADGEWQESVLSNEISYTVPPRIMPPGALTVTNPSVRLTIQSGDLSSGQWNDTGLTGTTQATGTNQVFRLRIAAVPVADTKPAPPQIPKLVSPKNK